MGSRAGMGVRWVAKEPSASKRSMWHDSVGRPLLVPCCRSLRFVVERAPVSEVVVSITARLPPSVTRGGSSAVANEPLTVLL